MPLCRDCGAKIRFIETSAGKWMPVDDEHIEGKDLEDGENTLISEAGEVIKDPDDFEQGYRPHWAGCPGAETFRKKKGEEFVA